MPDFLKRYINDLRQWEQLHNATDTCTQNLGVTVEGKEILLPVNDCFLKFRHRFVDIDTHLVLIPGYGLLLFRNSQLLESLENSELSSVTFDLLPDVQHDRLPGQIAAFLSMAQKKLNDSRRISLFCRTISEMKEDDPQLPLYVCSMTIMEQHPALLEETGRSGQLPHALIREYNVLTYIGQYAAERLNVGILMGTDINVLMKRIETDVMIQCENRSSFYIDDAQARIMDGLRCSRAYQELTAKKQTPVIPSFFKKQQIQEGMKLGWH